MWHIRSLNINGEYEILKLTNGPLKGDGKFFTMLDAYWWALITMTTVFFFCLSDIKEERLSFSLPLTKFHQPGWLRWHCTNHWSGKGDISQSKSPLPTLPRYLKRQILNKQHIRLLVPCAPSAGCSWLPCPSPSSATTLQTSTRARGGRSKFKRRGETPMVISLVIIVNSVDVTRQWCWPPGRPWRRRERRDT